MSFPVQCNHNWLHCKCNHNQLLLSRLHKMFDNLPCYIMPEMWFGRTDLPNDLCIYGKYITYSFALCWILISEILKQFNVGQWHHSLLYSFISRTYQKTHLVLTKQHVNTVMCLCLYYTCNRVNIDEESHSCLCYIHCNHDYLTV